MRSPLVTACGVDESCCQRARQEEGLQHESGAGPNNQERAACKRLGVFMQRPVEVFDLGLQACAWKPLWESSSSTRSTAIRVPLTTGFPARIRGSMTICSWYSR